MLVGGQLAKSASTSASDWLPSVSPFVNQPLGWNLKLGAMRSMRAWEQSLPI